MSDEYELRLCDQTLMRFEIEKSTGNAGNAGNAGYVANIKHVTEAQELLPIEMALTGEGVMKWLRDRVIPKNRAHVHDILGVVGLSLKDIKGIIDVSKVLSLNDCYWVAPSGFAGKFATFNLYENPFPEGLALTAVTGADFSRDNLKSGFISPEFTTNGSLPKGWRRQKGQIILFKGGVWRKYAVDPDPLEPYSEYYASQIGEAMGLQLVKYGLSRWKGTLGSTCPLFNSIDTAYVPMGSVILGKMGGKERSEIYRICGDWFKEFDSENGTRTHDFFASMLVFDGLILNEDRHLGNFGVLRDNKSGRIIGNAPIFDNGMSLFNFSATSEVRKLIEKHVSYTNYLGQSFEEVVQEFGGALQVEQLARLSGFKFKRHKRYNWESERLQIIEEYMRTRSKELIGIIGSKPM